MWLVGIRKRESACDGRYARNGIGSRPFFPLLSWELFGQYRYSSGDLRGGARVGVGGGWLSLLDGWIGSGMGWGGEGRGNGRLGEGEWRSLRMAVRAWVRFTYRYYPLMGTVCTRVWYLMYRTYDGGSRLFDFSFLF